MEENLREVEKFFEYDLKIKKILIDSKPETTYSSSISNSKLNIDSTVLKNAKKLFRSLEDIEFYITRILDMFETKQQEKTYAKKLFKTYKKKLINCSFDKEKQLKYYQNVFTNMREELVDKVGEKCYGYSMSYISLKEAESINELLHIIHSKITNNEHLYKKMPKLDVKMNEIGYPIQLYGKENSVAREIFEHFPIDLECGWTDILSLDKSNKVLMMIRDRGHALSLEIDEANDNKTFVKYHIPKICNVDMVNKLKGLNKKVDKDSAYATGIFQITKEELLKELYDFISKVPTDSDMKQKKK